jgi:major outer membrane protein
MKKLFVTMLAILTCGAAYALPVGNPSEASLFCDGIFWCGNGGGCSDPCNPCGSWCDSFNFRAGFYGDYVFNRHLKTHGHRGGNRSRHHIDHTRINTNAAYMALNLCNRFDVFATLGQSNLWLEGNSSSFGLLTATGNRFTVETSTEFSWSVGGRATLWECGCTALGLEGQYFRTNPRVKTVILASTDTINPSGTPRMNAQYNEWQVGLGVSHRINILVPYVAVKWSGADFQFKNFDSARDFFGANPSKYRNSNRWGYAVGVSLVDCGKAALTVEGRFADEKALYVNGQVRF